MKQLDVVIYLLYPPEQIFRVDDLVTERQSYKNAVDEIIEKVKIEKVKPKDRGSESLDISDEFMTNMGNAYMTSRKEKNCYSSSQDPLLLLNPDPNPETRELYYKIRRTILVKKNSNANDKLITARELVAAAKVAAATGAAAPANEKTLTQAIKTIADKPKEITQNTEDLNQLVTLEEQENKQNKQEILRELENYDCVKINDLKILRAISKSMSFSFEITGETYPEHYINWFQSAKEHGIIYDIYISCVFVSSFKTLVQRNQERFIEEYENYNTARAAAAVRAFVAALGAAAAAEFDAAPIFSAPRLPQITHILNDKIDNIKKNILKLYKDCFIK